jgi:peptide-methionine (R)-S-oxide reductase
MKNIILLIVCFISATLFSCGQTSKNKNNLNVKKDQKLYFPLQKSEQEWRKILTPISFEVMVKKGTEAPFKNPYYNNHQKGVYVSAATGEPLFSSEDKFDSGSGWPSFTKPLNNKEVIWIKDNSYGMSRDEVIETKTGLHLGHVFDDGPSPTRLRYCINSAALKFIPKK